MKREQKGDPQAPNFLTCPAFDELPSPKPEASSAIPPIPPPADDPIVPLAPVTPPLPVAPKPAFPLTPVPQASKITPPPLRPAPKHHRWIKYGIALLIALVLIVTLPAAYALASAASSAKQSRDALNRAEVAAKQLDFATAKTEILTARDDLNDAHDSLQETGFWRDVPGVGTQIRALEDAASAGAQTLDGAASLMDVFAVVTNALRGASVQGTSATGELTTGIAPTRSFNDLTKEEKRDLLAKFSNALPDLRLARDKIDIALELWDRVPQNALYAPLRDALAPIADALPKLRQTLDQGVPIIETMVPLLGYPQPIHYLVLLQNADELRPGGGFIGNVGTVTVDGGDVTDFAFTDVYNIDNPSSYDWHEVPPAPIAKQLGVSAWYLRDANWSPDFPTSANRILDFYAREVALGTGKPVADPPNAVLALEPAFFEDLLRLTGPVTVDGETYDASNFFDKIQYQVEEGFLKEGIPLEQRKDIVNKIGAAIFDKLKALPFSRWNEVTNLATQAFQRKQIMVYAQDPSVLKTLDAKRWTGRMMATNGDFLEVVDANLAALKTDGVMNKKVAYTLDATDPAHPRATVTLTYTNTNKVIDWRYTRYRSYTRIYVPDGATLISSHGAMKDDLTKTGGVVVPGQVDVTHELGKTVFGAFWAIEPGKTGTLTFTYALSPAVVSSTTYHLDWPKQAGADHTQLTLDLSFDKTLQSAVPGEDASQFGDSRYEYTTDSLEDRTFDLTFKK